MTLNVVIRRRKSCHFKMRLAAVYGTDGKGRNRGRGSSHGGCCDTWETSGEAWTREVVTAVRGRNDSGETPRMRGVRRGSHRVKKKKERESKKQ